MAAHPEVSVNLDGTMCNPTAVVARVSRALRKAGVNESEIRQFQAKATAMPDDPTFLLTVVAATVRIEGEQ